jgi:hypothetical protein
MLIQLRAGGLVIDPFFNSQIEQLAALVLHHTVPAVYEWRRIGLAPPMLLTRGPRDDSLTWSSD